MANYSHEALQNKVEQLSNIPCIEAILQPLIAYLQLPLEEQTVQRVVDLVSHDASLTAQCLHMANSPLFGRWQNISNPRSAVLALGLQRMRDIALSTCVLKLLPAQAGEQNPTLLWEHALACALVARKLAKRLGVPDPEAIYLAGLMHDIGFVVNLRLMPSEMATARRVAKARGCSLLETEEEVLGFNHCQSGHALAERWGLPPLVREIIRSHHRVPALAHHSPEIALISLCDGMCRRYGIGYGFPETNTNFDHESDLFDLIRSKWPVARNVEWKALEQEFSEYIREIQKLVSVVFRFPSGNRCAGTQ
jgi:putative nucleotidyltransferase with HDIG domain